MRPEGCGSVRVFLNRGPRHAAVCHTFTCMHRLHSRSGCRKEGRRGASCFMLPRRVRAPRLPFRCCRGERGVAGACGRRWGRPCVCCGGSRAAGGRAGSAPAGGCRRRPLLEALRDVGEGLTAARAASAAWGRAGSGAAWVARGPRGRAACGSVCSGCQGLVGVRHSARAAAVAGVRGDRSARSAAMRACGRSHWERRGGMHSPWYGGSCSACWRGQHCGHKRAAAGTASIGTVPGGSRGRCPGVGAGVRCERVPTHTCTATHHHALGGGGGCTAG